MRLRLPFLLALGLTSAANAVTLQIPATHPRLWYGNAARLAQAQTYFGTTPFTPAGADIQFERALRGVVMGNAGDCTAAATHLNAWLVENNGNRLDALRQQGEELLVIYDWCHGALTQPQIATLVARWNGYMDLEIADTFANQGSEANNYWWGRTRNLLMWGIGSFNDNPRAQEFINQALDTRFGTWFPSWYQDFGRGGVFPEGADYGVVSLSYGLIPFASAADFGFDPYGETPYFREAIYAMLYGTAPDSTAITDSFSGGKLLFPFNDDEHFHEGGVINTREYLGDFARYFGVRAAATGNAKHARAWLGHTNAGRRWMFDALGGTGTAADFADLPLDYYAPGAEVLDSRTSHASDATQVHLQLNTPGGVQHRHYDAGSFQIWRKGRWITRESAGYADNLRGFMNIGTIDTDQALAHNTLLFEAWSTGRWVGEGPHVIPPGAPLQENPRSLPRVTRLQHAPDFSYVAVDFSDAYRNELDTRVDWPYADKAWREFVFIRPLQALVILDRMRGSADSLRPYYNGGGWVLTGPHVTADQVRRTFVMHFETEPTAAANRLSATVGTQTAQLITLLPTAPTFRVFNEDVPGDEEAGQYRVELDSIGSTDSYFLNVVTGYDAGEAPLGATLTDNGSNWTLTLTHPTRGNATLSLNKGMVSTGGSLTVGLTTTPLREDVQGISVTTERPVWADAGTLFANGFE
jgi:hypothetical protein